MDVLTKDQRTRNMRAIKATGNKAETLLAKTLWKHGYRYRRNVKSLPGSPDIVLKKLQIAIFCDGDFWHGGDWETKKDKIGNNKEYWIAKIERNMARDKQANQSLQSMGWHVLRFWEKEILHEPDRCISIIKEVILRKENKFKSLEICAGAGGQALGLEEAGFEHLALIEIEKLACETMKTNRPGWNVIEADVRDFSGRSYRGQVDLFAGGVPCQPFSHGGLQLGQHDERDLFPEALRLIDECDPKAIMLENVRGLLDEAFRKYRQDIISFLEKRGYACAWKLLNASDFGVSQLRPRAVLVAMKKKYFKYFHWPEKKQLAPVPVGELLYKEMSALGWENVDNWRLKANGIAPTLVGGSKKHGGADLGPTRAKKAWAVLGVDGHGLADSPPLNGSMAMPRLTLQMAALIQGFPAEWIFVGKKTPAYRQVGNAFPPPVAKALGLSIFNALTAYEQSSKKQRIKK